MDQQTKISQFKQLTGPAIEEWAGHSVTTRGERYQREHRVSDLARTSMGAIVAWVAGSQRYATLVDMDEDGLTSACTCPYGGVCKHAVAVVLDYREHLNKQRALSIVPDTDPRLLLLEDGSDEEWDAEDGNEDSAVDAAPSLRLRDQPLRAYFGEQTQTELIDLLLDLSHRFPQVRDALEDRRKLATGSTAQVVRDARRLIAKLSAEPAWRNEWNGEGSIPDYSQVRDRLELLLRQGHADEVVDLGETLLEAGIDQVEQSHDEGETGEEIRSCLDIVFRALTRSSLQPAAQIQWAIDALLRDEYDLCTGVEAVWDQPFTAQDWSSVADALAKRLRSLPSGDRQQDFSRSYKRDRLSDWLISALRDAGREDEVIPLAEREAELNGNYLRLVKLLLAAGRTVEAEQWIGKGIAAVAQTQPGIARMLRDTLREMREKSGDWQQVATMRAEEFFAQPSLPTLLALQSAAEQVGVWPAVRAAALRYLETGEPPQATARMIQDYEIPAWPLSPISLPRPVQHWPLQFPLTDVLIAVAVHEQRPDEVLRWYDRRPNELRGWSRVDDRVIAEAVADAHPERAIAIWKRMAEAQIAQTQVSAYEVAVGYLRKLGELLERRGQTGEWGRYIAELRQANARKRRLVEMLDNLTRQGAKQRKER